uniref:HAT C-terminal dimerisation domain-containing protein n=1 Tax=Pelusios castaneus TaxID=367368 RepID=A0A8C8RBV3_9SAUR
AVSTLCTLCCSRNCKLVRLSDTHWSCQANTVNRLISNFPAVIQCLSDVDSIPASGLLEQLCEWPTVYCLFMFQSILSITEVLHKLLQKENLDLANTVDLKEAVCSSLKDMRTNKKAKEVYEKARALCVNNGIDIKETALQRRKQKRMDFVGDSVGGASKNVSTCDNFKMELFYPCLDRMLIELDQRFSSVKAELMMGIQACSPLSQNFLSFQELYTLAMHYKIELKPEETVIAKHYLTHIQENGNNLSMIDVYQQLDPVMFPNLKKVIQVALTIPVSSCSRERSFGALRRLHTWLRSTMEQDRPQHLAVLSIEKTALESVPEDAFIDHFFNRHNGKYTVMLPEQK